jgi:hypothetical protein
LSRASTSFRLADTSKAWMAGTSPAMTPDGGVYTLEHDPEKWTPVFGIGHAPS